MEQADLAASLKASPELNSFTFDGPWPVSGASDLLDNMYCADNGRYYETPLTGMASPVSLAMRAGTSRRFISSATSLPDALSRTNFFPAVFSAFALDWFVFGNGYLEMRKTGLVVPLAFVTRWRNTHAVVLTRTLTGLFRPGYRITCFQRARYATFSARIFTRNIRHA